MLVKYYILMGVYYNLQIVKSAHQNTYPAHVTLTVGSASWSTVDWKDGWKPNSTVISTSHNCQF